MKPAVGVAPNLLCRDVGIPQPRELEGNHAIGMGAAPLLEHPVVPRPHRCEAEFGIGRRERDALSDEAGQEGRKTDAGVDTVEIHVVDPGIDVPRAATHLVEAGGLEAILAGWSASDGVEAHVGDELAVPQPALAAVIGLDHPRRLVGELGREAALPHVGWLNDMVVGGDNREVDWARIGVREQGHPGPTLAAPAERLHVRELVDSDGHVSSPQLSTVGSSARSSRTAPLQ